MVKFVSLIFALLMASGSLAWAASLPTHAFHEWLQAVKTEAVAGTISSATVDEALDGLSLDDRVVDLDNRQPEKTVDFQTYVDRTITATRVQDAKRYRLRYKDRLEDVSSRYGVEAEIVLALWGIESSFGKSSGRFSTIRSLVTLAYEGRRSEFFRQELLAALRILDEQKMPSHQLQGSWAGAMGQCQFMPTTYLRHAVDADGDGNKDIWQNEADVFASIANYLVAEGWRYKAPWGREVHITQPIPESLYGLDTVKPQSEWGAMGLRTQAGKALPANDLQASLIRPDGAGGRTFLVYDNFRVLMRWNKSTYFATTVGLFADRIR